MSRSVPQLDVFYIDLKQEDDKKQRITDLFNKVTASVITGSAFMPVSTAISPALISFLSPLVYKNIYDLIQSNRFYIVRSKDELMTFENPLGNAWQENEKCFRQKQYYIRHPKVDKRHLLIESENFFDYIEQEQIEELVHFITAHCDAKEIRIERIEAAENSGNIDAHIENVDASAALEHKKDKRICVKLFSQDGILRMTPRENYHWIDGDVALGIQSLTAGSTYEKSYDRDFTFGLSAKEASTIGLKMNMHKNFTYSIFVKTIDEKKPSLSDEQIGEITLKSKKYEHQIKRMRFYCFLIAILAVLGCAIAALLAILL